MPPLAHHSFRFSSLFAVILLACLGPTSPTYAGVPVYRQASQPLEARVEDLLCRMTLEEKAAQLIGVWRLKSRLQTPTGRFSAEMARAAFPHGLGQIARPSDRIGLTPPPTEDVPGATAGDVNRGPRETAQWVNAAQRWAVDDSRLGIPLLMHEESLHGYVAPGATSFPQAIALASTWDPAFVETVFAQVAREMRGRGATVALGPVLDVARDPRWGRSEETYGEDPYLVSAMGLAAIRGHQGRTLPLAADKVLVTLKHMAAYGQPENGTNAGPAPVGERTLREIFLLPFERAIRDMPVLSVMPSYNEIDGVPSHANRWMLTDLLRGEWGFEGAVASDYGALNGLIARHRTAETPDDAAVMAMHAGVDVELGDGNLYLRLPELVRSGRIPSSEIDEAVRRVLRMKFQAGLFENPYVDEATAGRGEAAPEALALAREAARRAMILLKNDDSTLPLDAGSVGRLAVLGTHARNTPIGGYSDQPTHVVSVLEGLQAEGNGRFEVEYAEGVRITESRSWAADQVDLVAPEVNARLREQALEVARRADVVVMVLGENEQLSREAWSDTHLGDQASLDLVGPQNALAEAVFALGKPTIVVLLNGRPLSVNLLADRADALLEGWYLGQETGNAVADVLFGRVNPGGKLPVSIARHVGQLPIFYNHKPTARRGYLFDTTRPLYPFGFGLSYTTFALSPPRLGQAEILTTDRVAVEVDVENTGPVVGDEVVQLYLRDDVSSVTRPMLELKRFERITLVPGERRTVRFELTPDDFAVFDASFRRVIEPGTFTVQTGANSADLQSTRLTVREPLAGVSTVADDEGTDRGGCGSRPMGCLAATPDSQDGRQLVRTILANGLD